MRSVLARLIIVASVLSSALCAWRAIQMNRVANVDHNVSLNMMLDSLPNQYCGEKACLNDERKSASLNASAHAFKLYEERDRASAISWLFATAGIPFFSCAIWIIGNWIAFGKFRFR